MAQGRRASVVTELMIQRFEHFFRHADPAHNVLVPGDRAVACANIRAALSMLQPRPRPDSESSLDKSLYDEGLRGRVKEFQHTNGHRVSDGCVGPGTRRLLVTELLHRFDSSIFHRLARPEGRKSPAIFLSYAWLDEHKVGKLDQWLRDHGIVVVRDRDHFVAGMTIQDNITRALSLTDKIVAVYSANSRNRDWPNLERMLAEQVESSVGEPVLIYVRLDDTPLPAHDPTRLAIMAEGVPLKAVGQRLLHAITGAQFVLPRLIYDENQPM